MPTTYHTQSLQELVLSHQFHYAGTEDGHFPVHHCTIQDKREHNVFYGPHLFLCVVLDVRFPHSLQIRQMYPYLCRDETEGYEQIFYGWLDIGGDQVFDHWEKAIHGDYERVIAWHQIAEPIVFAKEAL